jgi:putative flippase GtrA
MTANAASYGSARTSTGTRLARLDLGVRLRRFLSVEVLGFLVVGGLGYVVDVGAFNVLVGMSPFDTLDPSVAKVVAVALAMLVTYLGNSFFTWRGKASTSVRQVLLFVVFNVVGLGFSILTLWISHDLLGLTSRLDDNVSANLIGLALGTAFRYWSYRRFVFDRPHDASRHAPNRPGSDDQWMLATVPRQERHLPPGKVEPSGCRCSSSSELRGEHTIRVGGTSNGSTAA